MKARIYQPPKTAMQSGRAQTHGWRLDYDTADARFVEPLMGWSGSEGTLSQVTLKFDTKEAAISYAERKGIPYDVEEPHERKLARRAYADNYAFNRVR
ncbi:ETC complex I subunit [Ferrovibrio sp.]|uniref:ETC complex I subunit n=1 Tax=Ferrovibrio sp. TaxID=1917215 RepID=UPI0025B876F4|nr:ETC complex I subunit [Ferrovibrio sp.]MBX3456693.1 ETC complex I subunit [Ferrovibrio sp.]